MKLSKLFSRVLFLTVMMSGCEQPSKETQPSQTEPKQAKLDCVKEKGNCLRLPLGGTVGTIDPGKVYMDLQIEVVEQLFLGLTTLEKESGDSTQKDVENHTFSAKRALICNIADGQAIKVAPEKDNYKLRWKEDTYKIVPELATSCEVNHDGTVYTFYLRQDVKWTDGKPVTANDLVWTIRRNLLVKSPFLDIIKNADSFSNNKVEFSSVGVRAIDNYTVRFTLAHAVSDFMARVSLSPFRPLPQHVIEKHKKNWTKPENISTNGPYRLKKWEKGNKIVLIKNVDYYEANKVKIKEVHYYMVSDNLIGLAMYKNNGLDIIGGQYLKLPQTEIPRLNTDIDFSWELKSGYGACTVWYGLNTHRFPTDQLQVREAIAYAIDKQLVIDAILKSNHIPATTVTPSWLLSHSEKYHNKLGIPFNSGKAKEFLKDAGYPEGKNFSQPIILMSEKGESDNDEIANAIQTLLKHYLKIDIQIELRDINPYYIMEKQKQFERPHIFRIKWCADFPNPDEWLYPLFHSKNGLFGWLLSGKEMADEFDQTIENARQVFDLSERNKLYRRAEQILTEEIIAVVPFLFENNQFLVKPWVKGWNHIPFGGQHISEWSIGHEQKIGISSGKK